MSCEVVQTDANDVLLRFRIHGAGPVSVPAPDGPTRTDGLWRTTCFELFLKPIGSEAYIEFNFSPSTQWAAYAFDGYREGMRPLPLDVAPHIDPEPASDAQTHDLLFALEADVDLSALPPEALLMGLSAVIEDAGGAKSYWALAHPPGPPDFHHPDCFALELPAAATP